MRKKYLNLCSGLLGNVFLLDENEWDITNVEFDEKIHNQAKLLKPNQTHILGDAFDYLIKHYLEFDFIWISPSCQTHSKMNRATRHKSCIRYIDGKLFEVIVFLKTYCKVGFVVENVVPYYEIAFSPQKLGRHLFWTNFNISDFDMPTPPNFINLANNKGKQVMMDWLGIHYEKNIYYKKNHCPVQILRNCVHPKTGLHILECYTKTKQPMPQSEDKIALDALKDEIDGLVQLINHYDYQMNNCQSKLVKLLDRKKSMENYLNSDKTLTEN